MAVQAINFGNNIRDNIIPEDSVSGAKANRLLSPSLTHNLVIKFKTGILIPLSLTHSANVYNIVIIINSFNVNK
jgi:hypothetical protein